MMRNLLFGLTFAGLLTAQQSPSTPPSLRVPNGQSLLMMAHGKGTQIYTCKAAGAGSGATWALKGPDAQLFDASGTAIAKHFAGPTWQANDGSSVKGKLVASAPAPSPNAIPWLLLSATSHSGNGMMTKVESIQRLKTSGGKAPESGCDASHLGAEIAVPYEADYYFYVAAGQ